MRLAESVTFGGSDLDRVAHLRGDVTALDGALTGDAVVIPIWRGKPMIAGDPCADDPVGLASLEADHPVFAESDAPAMLLGQIDGRLWFARDVSAWTPVEQVDPAQIGAFLDATIQRHPAAGPEAAFRELRSVMTALPRRDAELGATARALASWHRSHRFCARCGAESVMAMAGWQRDCPACNAHHFPRTDPVVIMLVTRGDRVLLGRSPGWPDRMYSLLAGFVEPGETIEAAVRREVFEESGVRVGTVGYLASQPWPYPASLMLGCHGEAVSEEITVDPVEIEAARWVTRSELLDVFAGAHPDIAPARDGAIAHFLLRLWLADRLD